MGGDGTDEGSAVEAAEGVADHPVVIDGLLRNDCHALEVQVIQRDAVVLHAVVQLRHVGIARAGDDHAVQLHIRHTGAVAVAALLGTAALLLTLGDTVIHSGLADVADEVCSADLEEQAHLHHIPHTPFVRGGEKELTGRGGLHDAVRGQALEGLDDRRAADLILFAKTFDLHLLAGMELSFKNAGEDLFVNGLVQIGGCMSTA